MTILKWFILSIVIVTAVSSFTLWLIEHPIKYFFFVFQVALTTILAWIFVFPQSSRTQKLFLTIRKTGLPRCAKVSRLDCLFVFLSASLLLMNNFNIHNPVNILFALVVVSLLPGYVLLRLTGAFNCVTYLDAFVLSYALSLALSGILPIFFMPITTQNNRMAFLGLLVFLSTLPILKDLMTGHGISKRKMKLEFSLTELLAFSTVIVFFAIVMINLYPRTSFIPGLDIVRNFSNARLWGLSPELLSSAYPFFHIYQSAIYSASTPSLEVYQTFLAFTSFSIFLSFYVMAKKYLGEIDNRIPIVAAVFWTVFSGFGWIYLFKEKLGQPSMIQKDLLRIAYDATYADIGYGLSTNLWLWFIAMTASFTIFFTLLYILRCKGIPASSLMILISVLVIGLCFIHASELVMFVLLLTALEFLGQKNDLCLDEALSSTIIALIGSIVISYLVPGNTLWANKHVPFLLIALVGPAYILHLVKWKGLSSKRRVQIAQIITYAFIVFFIAGLLSWLPLSLNFSMISVSHIFQAPWFFHPVRLGIVGLLGLLGMLVVVERYRENAVALFLFLFFTAWTMGRVISFVNVNFFYTGYSEWRFLFFSFAAASIISTLFLKHIETEKIIPKKSSGRIYLNSFLIGLLVLSGVSSTFLTIEKRTLSTDEKSLLDENELNAVSFLSSTFMNQKPAPLLTVTARSASALEFVPSPWVEKNIQPVIWLPEYPEIPLTFMCNLRFPPPYIYLHQRDLEAMSRMNLQNGYVARQLLQNVAEVYDNSGIKIYRLPNGVPPLPNGKSALVTPSNKSLSESNFLASYVLSLGGYNYTSILDSDPKISEKDIVILPSDSISLNDTLKLGSNKEKKIVILNLYGRGPLSEFFFDDQLENGETTATHLATPDAVIPLPLEITLNTLIAREEVHVLAWYANGVERTPIVAVRIFDAQTQVFYLNVHPLVRATSSGESATQSLLQILASLLDIVELPKYNEASTSWVIEDNIPVFAFKEGLLTENVSIYTESLIPSKKLNLSEIDVMIDNTQTVLNDVVALSLHNTAGKITLFSQNVRTSNGTGFYSFIRADSPKIKITGDNILISASILNGTDLDFEAVGTAKLAVNGSFSAYLRTPRIYNIGNSSFRGVYALHSYLGQLRTMGEDLFVEGEVRFGLPLSDQYSVASDFTWEGVASRDPPVLTWDELKSLVDSLPYFALAIGIFCTTYVATQKIRIRVGRRE